MCDYNWATFVTTEPCMYHRYPRTTALLLQIFLGAFGVGISVLGWYGAVIMYWSFAVLFCCCSSAFGVYVENDDNPGKGILSGMFAFLSVVGLLGTYVTAIVYIAGNHCMDHHGISCGS